MRVKFFKIKQKNVYRFVTVFYLAQLRDTHIIIMYGNCGRNVNKLSAPTEFEGKRLQLIY